MGRQKRSVETRLPFVDALNIIQAKALQRLRRGEKDQRLEDCLTITIQGIAAGMGNTG